MIVGWSIFIVGTPSTVTISDTGSSGWNTIRPWGSFASWAYSGWWKIATSADFNSGSGITITVTQNGSTTVTGHAIACDTFRVSSGSVLGKDLGWGDINNAAGTGSTYSPGFGASQPSNTDQLSWSFLTIQGANSISPSYSFMGTSPLAIGVRALQAGTTTEADTFYVGGVQADAVAASNHWALTWGVSDPWVIMSGTFYHS
jgi:hypothetical protein